MKFSKKVTLLIFTLTLSVYALTKAKADYNIVFIHIGEQLPPYIARAIKQARLFNKECLIYLISSKIALENTQKYQINPNDITFINYETLPKAEDHQKFLQNFEQWQNTRGKFVILKNFMKVTSERYLVLYDFIKKYNMHNVFHFENDVMIYVELEKLLPIFEKNYQLALPFDHDQRAPASFLYIKNQQALHPLISLFARAFAQGYNDMQIPALLAQINNNAVGKLPIIMPQYLLQHQAENLLKEKPNDPLSFATNFNLFNCIFDGAAIGQYLGGLDPHYYQSKAGFINEKTIFNVSHFTYQWQKDEKNRYIPCALLNNEKFHIANLHINAKNLEAFASDNPSIITNEYIQLSPEL